jgi:glycosyltransferase involved in cell wall biosynthesis
MISVITPVYNGQRFIESCIQVVIDQRCVSVEHIIVDGGSTDGTVDIILRYASDYPHIRWVSEKDRGQSDAMNKGIAMARGDIIGFLNVDDFYEPNVLNRVADIFRTLPQPAFVAGNCKVWDADEHLLLINRPNKLRLADLLLGPAINPFPVNPSAYFYNALVHRLIGLYDVDDHYTMDFDFLLRAVQVANVMYVDETWGNFRLLGGCKTLEDMRRGHTPRRQTNLVKTYRSCLPFWQRWQITIAYILFNHVWVPARYFRDHPNELLPRFAARMGRVVGLKQ